MLIGYKCLPVRLQSILALAQCDQQAAGAACLQPLSAAKAATCECIDEARQDLKRRIAGIGKRVGDFAVTQDAAG